MDITPQKTGDTLVMRLAGRLDASWSGAVQKEFDAAVRQGEHNIVLDLSQVDYISSAGLGVLLMLYKQLHSIKGRFRICAASPFVASALKLAGLSSLIKKEAKAEEPAKLGRSESSARARYEIFGTPAGGFRLEITGDPKFLSSGGQSGKFAFGPGSFALGIGSLGADAGGCDERLGEFLAVAGTAVFQPPDGSNRPDFVVSNGDFRPEGQLLLGIVGEGSFPLLARFEASDETRTVGLAELAIAALNLSGAPVAAVTAVVETAGLVGATLRQSPGPAATEPRFDFPKIREWLAFSNERIFKDSTALVTGVVAREGSDYQSLLRPLGQGIFGHFHAAVFPYRPLQKGLIELQPTVAALFETTAPNAVLHLLADNREFTGAGESEFLRGAIWIAPIHSKIP